MAECPQRCRPTVVTGFGHQGRMWLGLWWKVGKVGAGAGVDAPRMCTGPGSARQNGQGEVAGAAVLLKSGVSCGRSHTPCEMYHAFRGAQKTHQSGLRNNHT